MSHTDLFGSRFLSRGAICNLVLCLHSGACWPPRPPRRLVASRTSLSLLAVFADAFFLPRSKKPRPKCCTLHGACVRSCFTTHRLDCARGLCTPSQSLVNRPPHSMASDHCCPAARRCTSTQIKFDTAMPSTVLQRAVAQNDKHRRKAIRSRHLHANVRASCCPLRCPVSFRVAL